MLFLPILAFTSTLAINRIRPAHTPDAGWAAIILALTSTLSIEEPSPETSAAHAPMPPSVPRTQSTPQPFVAGPTPIGRSVKGRPLVVYRIGHGPSARALIGGIHGGYEWNTVELMSRTLEHLIAHPEVIPDAVTLYIIPLMNPDGLAAGTDRIHGRLNANLVDLNRNWDYQWQMTATHGVRPVSGGTRAFSEPESSAVRKFLLQDEFDAVVFYHSAMARVFPGAGVSNSHTVELAKHIAETTGYRYSPEGVVGQITTGDAIDWATANGITAIEIELTTHQGIDWEQNLRGLSAMLNWRLPRVPDEIRSAYQRQ